VDAWWNPKTEAARMRKAIEPHLVGIADLVSGQVDKSFTPQKADNLLDNVSEFVRRRGTERIPGILETTRESINRLIVEGFTSGLGPSEVAASIEVATAFDAARAELIARTESMLAYNEAALQSFSEFGVDRVEAIDGDEDEACAERNGQVFSVEDAQAITDHPNGTLDWAPVI
jgi:SPP1 gp7 family putative phage head morphogenesis protein